MTSRPEGRGPTPTVQIEIPTCWTPEQAAAVFDLIDEIREKIWAVHALHIQDEIQRQLRPGDI